MEINENEALIEFNPDKETQRRIAKALGRQEQFGISGQFVIQYDVEMDSEGGEVTHFCFYFLT